MKSKTKHTDQRGYFQELVRISETNHSIAQVSRFSIEPGMSRGDHYHNYLYETFVVLKGKCSVETTYYEKVEVTILDEGESFTIAPGVNHYFYSESGCEMLVVASKEFNPEETDTYVIER